MGFLDAAASFFGQRSANKTNIRLAAENRQWQERMSNTAYQRSAGDLEKAGLNRILALGSPATTPAGNVATVGNVGAGGTGLEDTAHTAMAMKRLKQELRNMQSEEKKTDAVELKETADANLKWDQRKQVQEMTKLVKQQIPEQKAQADFWRSLNSGGGSAKGFMQIAPLLKSLFGK